MSLHNESSQQEPISHLIHQLQFQLNMSMEDKVRIISHALDDLDMLIHEKCVKIDSITRINNMLPDAIKNVTTELQVFNESQILQFSKKLFEMVLKYCLEQEKKTTELTGSELIEEEEVKVEPPVQQLKPYTPIKGDSLFTIIMGDKGSGKTMTCLSLLMNYGQFFDNVYIMADGIGEENDDYSNVHATVKINTINTDMLDYIYKLCERKQQTFLIIIDVKLSYSIWDTSRTRALTVLINKPGIELIITCRFESDIPTEIRNLDDVRMFTSFDPKNKNHMEYELVDNYLVKNPINGLKNLIRLTSTEKHVLVDINKNNTELCLYEKLLFQHPITIQPVISPYQESLAKFIGYTILEIKDKQDAELNRLVNILGNRGTDPNWGKWLLTILQVKYGGSNNTLLNIKSVEEFQDFINDMHLLYLKQKKAPPLRGPL